MVSFIDDMSEINRVLKFCKYTLYSHIFRFRLRKLEGECKIKTVIRQLMKVMFLSKMMLQRKLSAKLYNQLMRILLFYFYTLQGRIYQEGLSYL